MSRGSLSVVKRHHFRHSRRFTTLNSFTTVFCELFRRMRNQNAEARETRQNEAPLQHSPASPSLGTIRLGRGRPASARGEGGDPSEGRPFLRARRCLGGAREGATVVPLVGVATSVEHSEEERRLSAGGAGCHGGREAAGGILL